MGLPTKAKTWQYAHTTVAALGTGLLDLQRGMRVAIVNALLAMTGAPTVAGSSDGVTAGMDAVNRWVADAALVWATTGNPHSWIVLQFGATKFFLLIDLNSAAASQMSVYMSFAGFTGGSTTTRPTATDEIQILGTAGAPAAWLNSLSDTQRVYHIMMPTDASAMRLVVFMANSMESWWCMGVAVNQVSGWTHPVYGQIHFANSLDGWPTYANLLGAVPNGTLAIGPAAPMALGYSTEATVQPIGQQQTIPNDLDGGYPMTAIGLYSFTVGAIGRHGQIEDMWLGSTTVATGDTYPSDGSATFVEVGDVVLPWDGTALTIA